MMFDGVNLLAVLAAAIGSFVFGAVWYTVLGKVWMTAAGITEAEAKPEPVVMGMTFVCQLVIAFVFAGIVYHTGSTSVSAGIISALFVGIGIIFPTMVVNHRFQSRPWSLTFIDSGHWLGGLLVQAVVLGLLS